MPAEYMPIPTGHPEARTVIAKYDVMVEAIRECHSVDDAARMKSQAAALETYAHQSRDETSARLMAEIKVRATRRMGELLAQIHVDNPTTKESETIANAGITKIQAHRAKRIASIPAPDFEASLQRHREAGKAPSVNRMDLVASKFNPPKSPSRAHGPAAGNRPTVRVDPHMRVTIAEDDLAWFACHERSGTMQRADIAAIAGAVTAQAARLGYRIVRGDDRENALTGAVLRYLALCGK